MIKVGNPKGRVITIRSISPISMDDVAQLGPALFGFIKAIGTRVVALVDLRQCGVVPTEVAEQFIQMLKKDNPVMERSAFLLDSGQATLGLQVERIIREAGNPNRRSFRTATEAVTFVSEVVTPEERAAVQAFVEESQPA
ncbi:MAG: hypothetical protein AB2A00_02650 [Myxococcota bacterium]